MRLGPTRFENMDGVCVRKTEILFGFGYKTEQNPNRPKCDMMVYGYLVGETEYCKRLQMWNASTVPTECEMMCPAFSYGTRT